MVRTREQVPLTCDRPVDVHTPPPVEALVTDPEALLTHGYRQARDITRAHGTTYYWGTLFLPPQQRRDVYGLYALCRLADDIVDEPEKATGHGLDASLPPGERLAQFEQRFQADLAAGRSDDPLFAAIVDTARRLDLDSGCYDRFFGAMQLDLVRTSWASWPQLRDEYMEGSAAVIGEMMLPVLRPRSREAAFAPARALGLAFQLTNFLRDVGEDLERGRVYLPADELAAHGADPWLRRVTPQWRAFMAEQIARNRALFHDAEAGLPHLPASSRRCVGAALAMYSRILCLIEAADYDVFSTRHRVSAARKSAIAGAVVVTGRARTAAPVAPSSSAAADQPAVTSSAS